jgi:FAD-dependent urate hydroxylase
MSVEKLSARVRSELTFLSYPAAEWTVPRFHDGRRALDVLIVGGGLGGLGTALGLRLERVNNFRIVDRKPRGLEGPWRRFARMATLRTPKDVTGIDFGIPCLTPRAWYEARFGSLAWAKIERIERTAWQEYLDWFRSVLAIPVENDTEAIAIVPAGTLLAVDLRGPNGIERIHVRRVVLATGIEGSGGWQVPDLAGALCPARYARAADEIDFARVAGKRVGILGGGASAFDNAGAALEAGAATVDLCIRRAELPRVNPFIWTNFAGVLGHFSELSDLQRWRFARCILEQLPVPAPQEAFDRCRRFGNFAWHTACGWRAVREEAGAVVVETDAGRFVFDFLIFATGIATDLSMRPELAAIADHVALWRDRFTPPPGEESDLLARHPYLGPAFEFMERQPDTAPFVSRIHNFTFGATPSHGLSAAAVTGMRYAVPKLVNGVVRSLFVEDAEHYYRELLAYEAPELSIAEAPSPKSKAAAGG